MMTLKLLAKKAGLAVSTVSAIMNNKESLYHINIVTAKRVRNLAEQLDYRPKGSARALLRGKSDCIGVLSHELGEILHNEIYNRIFSCINQLFYKKNISTMALTVKESYVTVPGMISYRTVDGILCMHYVPENIFNEIEKLKLPVVFLNADSPTGKDAVVPDDYGGVGLAVEYLAKLGHRRIAYLHKSDSIEHLSVKLRLHGYRDAMKKAGIALYPGWDVPLYRSETDRKVSGSISLDGFLNQILKLPHGKRPTAIIAYHSLWLRNIIRSMQCMKLKMPDDVSIICCGQSELVEKWIPAVTHVQVPCEEIAQQAVEMLYHKICNDVESMKSITIPEKLIVLESTISVK